MPKIVWKKNVVLAPYSTYKVGGEAKLMTSIHSSKEAQEAITYCKENQIRYYVLGKGSNTLFDDRGFDGAILLNQIEYLNIDQNRVDVGSGYSFPKLARVAAKQELSGLEFAGGVPASVGGAVYMNAGANGQEVSDVIHSVDYYDEERGFQTYTFNDMDFQYRSSSFHQRKGMILGATFNLKPLKGVQDTLRAYLHKRQMSQPLKEPSCGCVFRNAKEQSAGALIDQLGLKGYQIGEAKVSPIHANFIVNIGYASSKDILALVEHIENMVYETHQIKLERELRYIPYGEHA